MPVFKGCCDSGGTAETPSQSLIWEMPISTDSLLTERYVRDEANTPSGPTGTFSKSIVDIAAMPQSPLKALRLAVSAGQGGFVCPLNVDVALPSEGFVIEVYYSGIDSGGLGGFVMPLASFDEDTVIGVTTQLFSAPNNMAAKAQILSGSYARILGLTASSTGWSSAPNDTFATRGPYKQTAEVRKADGTTPANWTIGSRTECPNGSQVNSQSFANAWEGISDFDGLTFSQIGLGVFVPNGYGPANAFLDIQRLRILSLP